MSFQREGKSSYIASAGKTRAMEGTIWYMEGGKNQVDRGKKLVCMKKTVLRERFGCRWITSSWLEWGERDQGRAGWVRARAG